MGLCLRKLVHFTNAHTQRPATFLNTFAACPPPPSVDMLLVVRADVVKQSDDLQTLNSLNNLQQICCSPDVKQRFGHDAGSKMQINLVSICCSLLRSDWIQLRHLSENGRADIS